MLQSISAKSLNFLETLVQTLESYDEDIQKRPRYFADSKKENEFAAEHENDTPDRDHEGSDVKKENDEGDESMASKFK